MDKTLFTSAIYLREPEHHAQLRRYLDSARKSKLLRKHLDAGAHIRGLLATVEPCTFKPGRHDISVRIVDRKRAIEVLKQIRRRRLRQRRS